MCSTSTCIGRECEFLALTPDTSEVQGRRGSKGAVALHLTKIYTINLSPDEPSTMMRPTCHVDVSSSVFSLHKMLEQDFRPIIHKKKGLK